MPRLSKAALSAYSTATSTAMREGNYTPLADFWDAWGSRAPQWMAQDYDRIQANRVFIPGTTGGSRDTPIRVDPDAIWIDTLVEVGAEGSGNVRIVRTPIFEDMTLRDLLDNVDNVIEDWGQGYAGDQAGARISYEIWRQVPWSP